MVCNSPPPELRDFRPALTFWRGPTRAPYVVRAAEPVRVGVIRFVREGRRRAQQRTLRRPVRLDRSKWIKNPDTGRRERFIRPESESQSVAQPELRISMTSCGKPCVSASHRRVAQAAGEAAAADHNAARRHHALRLLRRRCREESMHERTDAPRTKADELQSAAAWTQLRVPLDAQARQQPDKAWFRCRRWSFHAVARRTRP